MECGDEGDPAPMRTGRSSLCALCNGKGAPGAHPGLVGNRGTGSYVPCPCSGQNPETESQGSECNPVRSCPSLPLWLCHPAAAYLVMVGGPLICFRSVL